LAPQDVFVPDGDLHKHTEIIINPINDIVINAKLSNVNHVVVLCTKVKINVSNMFVMLSLSVSTPHMLKSLLDHGGNQTRFGLLIQSSTK
jgi:hypothetical protein